MSAVPDSAPDPVPYLAYQVVQMPEMMSSRQLAELLTVSVRTVWRLVALGKFPPPIRFNRKLVRWRAVTIQQWLASLDGQEETQPSWEPQLEHLPPEPAAPKRSRAPRPRGAVPTHDEAQEMDEERERRLEEMEARAGQRLPLFAPEGNPS